MDLLELAVDGGLALQMLTVQALDELMSGLPALEVRVVAVTQVELAARRRVVAEPPAARFVTVELPHQRVDACGDRAENAELFKVGTEPRPEPVIGAGFVDGAGVHLKPVTGKPRVLKPDDQDPDSSKGQAGDDYWTPLRCCSPPGRRAARRAGGRGPRTRRRSQKSRGTKRRTQPTAAAAL